MGRHPNLKLFRARRPFAAENSLERGFVVSSPAPGYVLVLKKHSTVKAFRDLGKLEQEKHHVS
jgi:hypothetical protein